MHNLALMLIEMSLETIDEDNIAEILLYSFAYIEQGFIYRLGFGYYFNMCFLIKDDDNFIDIFIIMVGYYSAHQYNPVWRENRVTLTNSDHTIAFLCPFP